MRGVPGFPSTVFIPLRVSVSSTILRAVGFVSREGAPPLLVGRDVSAFVPDILGLWTARLAPVRWRGQPTLYFLLHRCRVYGVFLLHLRPSRSARPACSLVDMRARLSHRAKKRTHLPNRTRCHVACDTGLTTWSANSCFWLVRWW